MTASPRPLGVMTRNHRCWDEFYARLEGPEGCNFRKDENGKTVWECNANDGTLPKARGILRSMGATETEIVASVLYFHANGGFCDCEVLFNVKPQRPVRRHSIPNPRRKART